MFYLMYEEYQKMGFSKLSAKRFEELERFAEFFLDQITMNYYQFHDIGKDTNTFRVNQFKKAMALETEYLETVGGTSLIEIVNNTPASVSVGRMSLSMQNSGTGSVGKTMVSIEAYRALFRTGLLYRGVGGI
ncbi:hypothetical protein [Enterococcus faecium]|uniref:hypothetical protein n=1 Tax=Enterococcus faecium TaxID=1352 RepID=UPI0019F5CD00|nr:hypothetical protein [Enterococcus faecium]EME7159874.1 hypothetical protein [Enterococcus faecium]